MSSVTVPKKSPKQQAPHLFNMEFLLQLLPEYSYDSIAMVQGTTELEESYFRNNCLNRVRSFP